MNGWFGLALLLGCGVTAAALADGKVLAPNQEVDGKPLSEYANLWWQWASSMPAAESPVRDQTGVKCDVNQQGPVWFLAGGYGTSKIVRHCRIPKDRYVFFPVINMIEFSKNANADCTMLKNAVAMNNDHLTAFEVVIDDRKQVNPAFHRYSSEECFNLLAWPYRTQISPQVYPAATDGYWVMLAPLDVGKHHIKFKAEYRNPSRDYGMMKQDIEYTIEVVETLSDTPKFNLLKKPAAPQTPGI